MTKQIKSIKETSKETAETILENTLLDLTLSEIAAFGFQKPEMTVYEVHEVKAPEKVETLNAVNSFEVLKQEENTLNIDIVVAFCWWAIAYVVKSLVDNICNYLVENPLHHDIVASQQEKDASLSGANADMDVTTWVLGY